MSYLDVVGVEYAEETYAKKSGEYPNLTAGTAEGLIGQSYEVDQSAYLYRKSHDGGRVREQIIGGTVAWNQLVNKASIPTSTNRGITFTNNDDGTWTLNGTADAQAVSAEVEVSNAVNHVFYFSGSYMQMREGGASFMIVTDSPRIGKNVSAPVTVRFRVSINITLTNLVVTPQVIDLTAMFGSTIADYIYSLEQATAGAGVAWLKQYIDLDTYHAYNAGSLESVQTEGREIVGFNQWDEEWEVGTYNLTTGEKAVKTTKIRCKNMIRVLPNTNYYFYIPSATTQNGYFAVLFYDASGTFISSLSTTALTKSNGQLVTTSSNCYFITFLVADGYGTTYNHDICINLSDPAKNGTYKPYEKHTYPVSNVELRGMPKLVDNQLAFDGDVYAADGTVTRRYRIVDLGSLEWEYSESATFFSAPLNPSPYERPSNMLDNALTTIYQGSDYRAAASMRDKQFMLRGASLSKVYIKDSSYTDAATFTTAMSGEYLVYELATPTTETADPYAPLQEVGNTERWIDSRDVPVPVGQNSKYYPDYAEKIDSLPSDFSTLIAPVEKTFTATRNYTADEFLIVNNTLYQASANIASGTTITPGTNVVAKTIADILTLILTSI